MTQDDMVKVARECGIGLAYGRENIERFYTFVAAAEKQKVVEYMNSRAFATGHGDTVEDLLKELEWQVAEREREACAKLCDEKYEAVPKNDPYAEADGDYSDLIYAGAAQDCAEAIRARGET